MVNSIEKVKTKKRKQTDDTNDGTCTKRTLLTTSKKVSDLKSFGKENNNKDNEISDSELYEKHIYHLQKFLSDKYVDVIDRLKLNYIPNCVRDLLFCKNNHSKNCPGPPIISKMFTYRINQFLIEKRPLNYIKICNSIMQQGIIPDENIFNSIFQLIISYGFEDEILHYTNEYLINESKLTLINFINLFPPCWKGNRNIYLNFCTNPVDQTKYLPENSDPVEKRNMFLFIVYMIEKVAKEEEETLETSVPESEIILNFNEWERKNSKCNNMNAFTREEKLNRLFLSLDIFVKIFETDLSLWILRYLSNPYKHLFTCDKPLIVAALLIKESNFMSDHILKIIELFVSLILNNYPKFQIIVFKRLLSLIYVVINLADAEENAINFPNFKLKSKTMQFSKQIFDSLAGELNFIKFFKIYNHIEIPLVRLLIIDHFIKKLDKDKTAATDYLNPKLIFERFRKLLWQKYEISSTPINYLNEKIINIPYEEKFPNYPKIENKILEIPVLKIYREQYLYLYLEALKAYCDAFFTKNFLLILMDCNTIKPTIVLTKEIEPKKITKKFKLEKLEKDASKLLMGIDLDKAFGNSSSNEIPEYGVDVTYEIIVQYRSDYKYLSLLKKNLPIMIQKFGKEFDIFTEFIEYCFTPE